MLPSHSWHYTVLNTVQPTSGQEDTEIYGSQCPVKLEHIEGEKGKQKIKIPSKAMPHLQNGGRKEKQESAHKLCSYSVEKGNGATTTTTPHSLCVCDFRLTSNVSANLKHTV